MTYSPTIYDWHPDLPILSMAYRAGGLSISGGMTLGGAAVENPEPGGRGELLVEFSAMALTEGNLAASWAMSRIMAGNVIQIPLPYKHVQLVSDADLGITTPSGLTWSNGLPWSGGIAWAADPLALLKTSYSAGATTIRVDTSAFGNVLQVGHVIGIRLDGYHFCHKVMNASGTAANRTIEISPPLRRDATSSNAIRFRPYFLGVCTNAREVQEVFRYGKSATLPRLRFVEALV